MSDERPPPPKRPGYQSAAPEAPPKWSSDWLAHFERRRPRLMSYCRLNLRVAESSPIEFGGGDGKSSTFGATFIGRQPSTLVVVVVVVVVLGEPHKAGRGLWRIMAG